MRLWTVLLNVLVTVDQIGCCQTTQGVADNSIRKAMRLDLEPTRTLYRSHIERQKTYATTIAGPAPILAEEALNACSLAGWVVQSFQPVHAQRDVSKEANISNLVTM
jgi:hypothetical protein